MQEGELTVTDMMPENLFREFVSKLIAVGLPEHKARIFAEECYGYRNLDRAYFEFPVKQELPSDDYFRTLSEALKIYEANHRTYDRSWELPDMEQYLQRPYSDVIAAKKAIAENFRLCEPEIEAVYAKDQNWLLISADSVNEFAAFLRDKLHEPELMWTAYQLGAFLGLRGTQQRMEQVLELLGEEVGWQVIRNDAKNDGLLYYCWFTDPIGCIAYMLECGLTPDQIRRVLEEAPMLLYWFKEYRKRSYGHDQEYIDRTIRKYAQET